MQGFAYFGQFWRFRPNHGIFCEKCIERKDEWATNDMYKR